jgi:hypothetical protein
VTILLESQFKKSNDFLKYSRLFVTIRREQFLLLSQHNSTTQGASCFPDLVLSLEQEISKTAASGLVSLT